MGECDGPLLELRGLSAAEWKDFPDVPLAHREGTLFVHEDDDDECGVCAA